MSEKIINVATDFSRFPFGRKPSQSNTSGEAFREVHLIPALKANTKVTIILDGAQGYGSSFLEEAFGGLIRNKNFSYQEAKDKLKIISTVDPTLITEIDSYMQDAQKKI